jgi:hypothetical protein
MLSIKIQNRWVKFPKLAIVAVIDPCSITPLFQKKSPHVFGFLSYQGKIALVVGKEGSNGKKMMIFENKKRLWAVAIDAIEEAQCGDVVDEEGLLWEVIGEN